MDYTNKEYPFYYHKRDQYPNAEQQVRLRRSRLRSFARSNGSSILAGALHPHISDRTGGPRGLRADRRRNRGAEARGHVLHDGRSPVLGPLVLRQRLPGHRVRLLGNVSLPTRETFTLFANERRSSISVARAMPHRRVLRGEGAIHESHRRETLAHIGRSKINEMDLTPLSFHTQKQKPFTVK